MRIVSLAEVRAAASFDVVFGAVRDALIAHAAGATQIPPPMHLVFPDADGDCHVKAGYMAGAQHFAVKIASGFYRNSAIGLPNNNGLVLVVDATNGVPAAILADEGWLTAWRTAAAGALITHALTPPEVSDIAVMGTGLQARLQVVWLRELRTLNSVRVWGRRADEVNRLCTELAEDGINASPGEIAGAECVITATAATTPLAPAEAFSSAVHVTALGTDLPGKGELPPDLFASASIIATDDHEQCLHHGDFGNAVRAGVVSSDSDVSVGTVLRDGVRHRSGLSIADLTGIGAADAAVASAVLTALG
ncbi:ornithine cyclodeaminase [Kibdelosporangium aridum]|uniref:ornithine cyclodeaminase n=1 Tax=Kibdelosporangium aridum TaxID=2030 RepID=UPI00055F6D31|nr:ornithine cyclodeaminase [Kibdelosporangium aridum]